jgi:hypothetical protein
MSVARKLPAVAIIWALMLQNGYAGADPTDWANVRNVKVGRSVSVITRGGERYDGYVRLAGDDHVTLVLKDRFGGIQTIDLPRSEVLEVRLHRSRWASAAITAGIGAGIGLGLGAIGEARSTGNEDRGLLVTTLGFLGAMLGCGVGLGRPLRGKRIYVAP